LSPVRGRWPADDCRRDKLTRFCWSAALHGGLTRLPGEVRAKPEIFTGQGRGDLEKYRRLHLACAHQRLRPGINQGHHPLDA
jgi:hypothetical protein